MDRDLFDFAPETAADEADVERPEGGEDDLALMAPVLAALKTVRDPEIPMDLVEHARRGRGGDPCRPRRHRCPGQARLDAALGSGEDERRGAARARHDVTPRPIRNRPV